jgi:hypothetical protein
MGKQEKLITDSGHNVNQLQEMYAKILRSVGYWDVMPGSLVKGYYVSKEFSANTGSKFMQ